MKGTEAPSLASRLDALPIRGWHWYLLAICFMGLMFDSFDVHVVASVLPKLLHEWKLNDAQMGFISSAGFFGMLVGSTAFGLLADSIGRLKVFAIALVWYSIFTGAIALTTSFNQIVVMRFVEGLGLGGLLPVASAYIAEYVPSRRRGQFVSYLNAGPMWGNTLAYLVGFAIIMPYGWKWGFILGAVPALLVAFVWRGLPESVRYLMHKGKIREAVDVVEKLELRSIGKITVPHEEAVEAATASVSGERKVRYRDLFTGGFAKTTIMVSLLAFCYNYALYSIGMWFPVLFTRELHWGLATGFKLMAVGTVIGVAGEVLAGYVCEHWGRRPSITCSYIGYGAACYFLFIACKGQPSLGVVGVMLYAIAMGFGWGSLGAYLTENFPTKVRATGAGFAYSVGRCGGIAGPAVIGVLYWRVGMNWLLHLNMLVLLTGVVVMFLLGHETKRKTLEDITKMQSGKA